MLSRKQDPDILNAQKKSFIAVIRQGLTKTIFEIRRADEAGGSIRVTIPSRINEVVNYTKGQQVYCYLMDKNHLLDTANGMDNDDRLVILSDKPIIQINEVKKDE